MLADARSSALLARDAGGEERAEEAEERAPRLPVRAPAEDMGRAGGGLTQRMGPSPPPSAYCGERGRPPREGRAAREAGGETTTRGSGGAAAAAGAATAEAAAAVFP
jgi:hypothetical protein